MHSNDHIKENWAMIEGGGGSISQLLWGNRCYSYMYCIVYQMSLTEKEAGVLLLKLYCTVGLGPSPLYPLTGLWRVS